MKSFYVFFCLPLLLFGAKSALACTCSDYGVPSCKSFASADAVFVGKIEQIVSAVGEKNASATTEGIASISSAGNVGLISVHLKVEKAFKGVQDKIVKVLTLKGTSCDVRVKKGERWVIYASKDDNSGFLSIGFCGASYKTSKDDEAIAELENRSLGSAPMSVRGRLTHFTWEELKDAKVYLEGSGLSLSTVTGKSGDYKFDIPAPGKYKVKVVVPFSASVSRYEEDRKIKAVPTETETVVEYEADVSAGNCDYEYLDFYKIDLKATAAIDFKFSSPGLKEYPPIYPKLCRLKATEQETLESCLWRDPKAPDVSYGYLREGRFVIVVSENDFPTFSSPFMRHYYPGVRNFAEAQIIDLQQGQKLTLPDFKLPPPIPTQEVKGRLFWKNGKPVLPAELTEDGVYFQFYNPQKKSSSLGMSHYISPSEQVDDGLRLDNEGNFSFRGFVGTSYFIRISAENKKEKEYSKELEIKVDENLKFLEVILDTPRKN